MRQFREYRRMCQIEGFTLLDMVKGRKHCRLIFETGFVIAAVTPSDNRNLKNVRSAVRRLHR